MENKKRPVIIDMECAKGEILNALARVEQQFSLPSYIVEGILASILSDIRSQKSLELINAINYMQEEGAKDDNIEKTDN